MKYLLFLKKDIFKDKMLYILLCSIFFFTTIIYLATYYSLAADINNRNEILTYFTTADDINETDRKELLNLFNKPLRNSFIKNIDKCELKLIGDYSLTNKDYNDLENKEKIIKLLNEARKNSKFEESYINFSDCKTFNLISIDEKNINNINKIEFKIILNNIKIEKNDKLENYNKFDYVHINLIENDSKISFTNFSLLILMFLNFIYNLLILKIIFKYLVVKKLDEYKIYILYGETFKNICIRNLLYIMSCFVLVNILSYKFYQKNILLSNLILVIQCMSVYFIMIKELVKYYNVLRGDKYD